MEEKYGRAMLIKYLDEKGKWMLTYAHIYNNANGNGRFIGFEKTFVDLNNKCYNLML